MKTELQKLKELTHDIKMAMLTTLAEDGTIHSRPMGTQELDEEGNIWFFTSSVSTKVVEINDHHQVNLAYVLPEDGSYVSIAGTAELVHDRIKAQELWNPALKAWFPLGLDEPDLALLKVRIDSAEYWDAPQGKMVELFKMAGAAMTGRQMREVREEHGRANSNRH